MTIRAVLQEAKHHLMNYTDCPQLEAEILLLHSLNQVSHAGRLPMSRPDLHAWPEKNVSSEAAKLFFSYIVRRTLGEPVAYITGEREFWSLPFSVNTNTLVPRPETELLVEKAFHYLSKERSDVAIADLGTGSGAIAIALAYECPRWQVHATDQSQAALNMAKKNAKRLALENIYFYHGDWYKALPNKLFDAILSNPPYLAESEWPTYAAQLAFEPYTALVSGKDGLDALRVISATARLYLKQGGYLIVEHGSAQGEAVRELFASAQLVDIHSCEDLGGQQRVTIGRAPK